MTLYPRYLLRGICIHNLDTTIRLCKLWFWPNNQVVQTVVFDPTIRLCKLWFLTQQSGCANCGFCYVNVRVYIFRGGGTLTVAPYLDLQDLVPPAFQFIIITKSIIVNAKSIIFRIQIHQSSETTLSLLIQTPSVEYKFIVFRDTYVPAAWTWDQGWDQGCPRLLRIVIQDSYSGEYVCTI